MKATVDFHSLDVTSLNSLLDAIPDLALVLDNERRSVFVNHSMVRWLGESQFNSLLGLRTGELINCIHAHDHADGCGESESCKLCGANKTIRLAMESGKRSQGECRITIGRQELHVSLDLEIGAHPFRNDGQNWLLVTIQDISDQKRRRALEKIFFHDIINTAGGLRGLLDLMQGIEDPRELRDLVGEVASISRNLLEEIQAQKELNQAENGELSAYIDRHLVAPLIREAAHVVSHHQVAKRRGIIVDIDPVDPALTIHTDRTLLMRVLVNMLKNAIEASPDQGQVNLYVHVSEAGGKRLIRICVHNDGHMSREVQMQLFQRSFSTKAPNRGLGTYSMKLLTERYLKGQISFESAPETGTTFVVELSDG